MVPSALMRNIFPSHRRPRLSVAETVSGGQEMDERKSDLVAKVPQVTLLFWIIKILATTLGETGGDAVTMSWLGETTPEGKAGGYLIVRSIFSETWQIGTGWKQKSIWVHSPDRAWISSSRVSKPTCQAATGMPGLISESSPGCRPFRHGATR